MLVGPLQGLYNKAQENVDELSTKITNLEQQLDASKAAHEAAVTAQQAAQEQKQQAEASAAEAKQQAEHLQYVPACQHSLHDPVAETAQLL